LTREAERADLASSERERSRKWVRKEDCERKKWYLRELPKEEEE
jgi:hypothetical protein